MNKKRSQGIPLEEWAIEDAQFKIEMMRELGEGEEKNQMRYKHYSLDKARLEFEQAQKKKYKVITINWTCATEKGKPNENKVHKNEYIWTLGYLTKWIFASYKDICEDIIRIEALDKFLEGGEK